ncbi:hypothetical protein GCM10010975_36370 [Comamonas phosphati]|nr:hypothetical protein GCM10010975_36370 [Comamonas phosphati]
MTEDQLEQETLAWLAELGYAVHGGPDIAHDGGNPQRASYRQVVLPFRLREAIQRLNGEHCLVAQSPIESNVCSNRSLLIEGI